MPLDPEVPLDPLAPVGPVGPVGAVVVVSGGAVVVVVAGAVVVVAGAVVVVVGAVVAGAVVVACCGLTGVVCAPATAGTDVTTTAAATAITPVRRRGGSAEAAMRRRDMERQRYRPQNGFPSGGIAPENPLGFREWPFRRPIRRPSGPTDRVRPRHYPWPMVTKFSDSGHSSTGSASASDVDFDSKFGRKGLTFDDVTLIPAASSVLPHEADTSTLFARDIYLSVPIVAAAMDTVTEAPMAIALARLGGIGVIHRNLAPEDQADQVDRVKRSESGMITDPETLHPEQLVREARDLMNRFSISGVPITDMGGRLVGILTNRDLRFETDDDRPIGDVMTSTGLVTAPEGTSLDQAKDLFRQHKIEKLPVVTAEGRLCGLITIKDIQKRIDFPNATKDSGGRLRCAAALGVSGETMARAKLLIDAGVDALVIDTAHGHSAGVADAVSSLRRAWDGAIIAGNIATAEAARALIEAGADAVKVGIGPGAICTTRVVTGIGVPQITAIWDCAREAARQGIPVIADGGIQHTGDVAKAIAAGASSVMLGSMLAGVDESPGDIVFYQGERFKDYRGMGSLGAMKQRSYSKDRYFQGHVGDSEKLVPEGIEARVAYQGPLEAVVHQIVGGLRSSLGYTGCANLAELRERGQFVQMTSAGLREAHPHDVTITDQAPNYRTR